MLLYRVNVVRKAVQRLKVLILLRTTKKHYADVHVYVVQVVEKLSGNIGELTVDLGKRGRRALLVRWVGIAEYGSRLEDSVALENAVADEAVEELVNEIQRAFGVHGSCLMKSIDVFHMGINSKRA